VRRSVLKLAFAFVAAVFFATPVVLRSVGVRARLFENRPLAVAPRFSQGWSVFDQMTRFLVDRMPLREQAVHANTWLSRHVFDTTPRYGIVASEHGLPFGQPQRGRTQLGRGAPAGGPAAVPAQNQVLGGRAGWLYLAGDPSRDCFPFLPFDQALARWERVVSTIRASGRRAVMIIVPEKSAVYPEHLPPDFPDRQCAMAGRRALWSLLDGASRAGVVGLLRPLLAIKRQTSETQYLRKDSHWNSLGALVLIREALARVGRGVRVRPSEVLDLGPGKYVGDLTALLGSPQPDSTPQRAIRRRPDAPRVSGRTLYVRDSFGEVTLPLLTPYFSHFQTIYWFDNSPPQLVNAIAAADTVILELAEREFTYRASDNGGFANPGGLALLSATLRPRPSR